jgi:hypothetical protein
MSTLQLEKNIERGLLISDNSSNFLPRGPVVQLPKIGHIWVNYKQHPPTAWGEEAVICTKSDPRRQTKIQRPVPAIVHRQK